MRTRRRYHRTPFRVSFGRDIQRGPDAWTLVISWAPFATVSQGSRVHAHGIVITWRNPIFWSKY